VELVVEVNFLFGHGWSKKFNEMYEMDGCIMFNEMDVQCLMKCMSRKCEGVWYVKKL
jgi:hypothetical protein